MIFADVIVHLPNLVSFQHLNTFTKTISQILKLNWDDPFLRNKLPISVYSVPDFFISSFF